MLAGGSVDTTPHFNKKRLNNVSFDAEDTVTSSTKNDQQKIRSELGNRINFLQDAQDNMNDKTPRK